VIFPESNAGEKSADRYSIAYFGHPIGNTVLEAVPSERVRLAGKQGGGIREETGVKAMTADEHLMSRLKATYLGMYRDGEGEGKEGIAAA
jgi:hypothetical protein